MIDFEAAPGERTSGISPWDFQGGWQPENEEPPSPFEPLTMETPLDQLPQYLQRLNPPQRRAALTTEGPLIVLAGAGSGKTSMLTARMAYLIGHCHVPAYRVLAVTFTNKAAAEMKERVERAIASTRSESGAYDLYLSRPEIGTFHSVCVRILRKESQKIGFKRPFVIYDDSDQLTLIKSVMVKLNLDPKALSPKLVQSMINRFKCDALEPHELEGLEGVDLRHQQIYQEYQKDLFQNNAVDFGEIICLTYRLFRDHEDVRKRYQQRFAYVHVDEYQDTNRSQYLLLKTLTSREWGGNENFCVVGDEDQSIYRWRGADIRNILDFEKDFGQATVVKLEQNYRSTQNIITAASHLIGNNRQRKNKKLWTENDLGTPIVRYQLADDRMEAQQVVSEMMRLVARGEYHYDDFAIFYRTHAQSRQFEDVLRRQKLTYQIVGGVRFYDRREIKDILSYFKVILNPSDSVSLKRIINVPGRGIGKSTLDRLENVVHRGAQPDLWSAIQTEAADANQSQFSKRVAFKLQEFVRLLNQYMGFQSKHSLLELYHQILDTTAYVASLKKEDPIDAEARTENLEEFGNLIQEFEEEALQNVPEPERPQAYAFLLARFIEQTTLVTESDQAFAPSSVKLMTLHSSKGLEFPVVFMVGMEEGLFPSVKPWEVASDEDVEEERRLCYVGMTRAERRLYLMGVSMRRIWGNWHQQEPSRFFVEIPDDLIDFKDFTSLSAPTHFQKASSNVSNTSSAAWKKNFETRPTLPSLGPWKVGIWLDHPSYGKGKVVAVEGLGADQKISIDFEHHGKKKFLVKYLDSLLKS